MPESSQSQFEFLVAGGDTGALIRSRDWSATPLGPVELWPQSLRTATGILLESPVPIVMLWGEEGIMLYNDAYSIFAGARHPQLLGSKVREGWPEVADFNDNVMNVVLAGGTLSYRDQELTLFRKGHPEKVWMNLDYSPVRDESGKPAGVIAIVVETTEKVLAERENLAESERLKQMFEQAPGFMAMLAGPEHVFEMANPAYMQLVGNRDVIGKSAREAFPEVEGQGFLELLDEVYRTGEAFVGWGLKVALQASCDASAKERFVDFVYQPITDGSGSVSGIFVQGADVSARKEFEDALRASETRLRLAIGATQAGEWELDLTTDTSVRAPRHDQIFGYQEPVEKWGFKTFIAHVVPEDRPAVEAAFATAAETGTGWHFECRIRRAGDGEIRWIAAHSEPQLNDSGQVVRLFGLVQDITDKRRMQENLRLLNETLEAQVAQRTAERDRIWIHSNELMGVFGFDGRRRAINPAWSRVLGYDEETLLNTPFNEITHPDDRESLKLAVQRLAKGEKIVSFEDRLRDKDGTYHHVSWTGVPAGELFYAIGRDVTEQREAENALRHAQKMEAVGQLTGGIAHDFNNMLAVVIGGLNLLQRRLARGETDLDRYINAAMDGATRAASLTQRLLAFSRQQPLQPKPVAVNLVISGLTELLARTLGEDVQVQTELAAVLWNANVDPGQLENTILNLAVNARDAMLTGGRLTIETANTEIPEQHARELDIAPGQYVVICVTDTGTGMTPEIQAKAFEPFFTTKQVGKGTGLGLSQVFGFVRQSGGQVKIYSEVGRGTTVKVYLPRFHGEATAEAPKQSVAPTHRGRDREIVMVVEDEERVRRYSVEALRELGYTVVHAASGREALQMIDGGQQVSLLFTDIVMPGMTGRELAETASAKLPHMKVLFTTGFAPRGIADGSVLHSGGNLLHKPFGIDDLAAKVRDVLDGQ